MSRCCELSDENELTINDIYATIPCGLAVNRDRVLAQVEGDVVYGLSMARCRSRRDLEMAVPPQIM